MGWPRMEVKQSDGSGIETGSPREKTTTGRPKQKWTDKAETILTEIGIRDGETVAQDGDGSVAKKPKKNLMDIADERRTLCSTRAPDETRRSNAYARNS